MEVKAKKKMAAAMKMLPPPPTWEESARWVSSTPVTPEPGSNWPDIKMMAAVQVQMTMVSRKTPSICT